MFEWYNIKAHVIPGPQLRGHTASSASAVSKNGDTLEQGH